MPRTICPNCSNAYTPASGGSGSCPKCGYGSRPTAPTYMAPAGAATFSPAISPPGPDVMPASGTMSTQVQPTNGFAVTSMVLGIVAIIPGLGMILGLLAVIFGIIGLVQVKKKAQRGFGMAITGLILGSIVLLLHIAFYGFVFSLLR